MQEIDELRAGRRAIARRDPRLPSRSEERRTRPGEGQPSDRGLIIQLDARHAPVLMVGLIRCSHNQAQNFMFQSSAEDDHIRPSPGQSIGAMHPAPGRPPSYPH